MTPAGIEPTPIRFVAQHLNHCATRVRGRTKVLEATDTSVRREAQCRAQEGKSYRGVTRISLSKSFKTLG